MTDEGTLRRGLVWKVTEPGDEPVEIKAFEDGGHVLFEQGPYGEDGVPACFIVLRMEDFLTIAAAITRMVREWEELHAAEPAEAR